MIVSEGGEAMEWIRISENKIKVMLTAEDAARYALSPTCKEQKSGLDGQSFRAILSDVREAADFDASEDKVYVQLYPSKEGGFELFITKMGVTLTENERSRPTYPYVPREIALSFDTLPALIALCHRLQAGGFSGKSAAYLDEASRYWLLLRERSGSALVGGCPFAAEYGRIEEADTAKILLDEHARCICERQAVKKLGALY